jgi:signal peptidase II
MPIGSQSGRTLAAAGLALLIGVAPGNATDRIAHGAVTDFFEVWFGFYHYPAFSAADSDIAIGTILILLKVLFPRRVPPTHSVKSYPGQARPT